MNTRGRDGIFTGVGAGLTLIVLLVLQSVIGTGLLSTRTVTTTTTQTILPPVEDYNQVVSAYTNHLSLFSSRNASAFLSGYEGNATVEWTEDAGGLSGNYTGNAIAGLITTFLRNMVNSTLSNESQPVVGVQGRYWVVTSTFHWAAYSPVNGNVGITVAAEDSYAYVGNTWLIAQETWTWISLTSQYPGGLGL